MLIRTLRHFILVTSLVVLVTMASFAIPPFNSNIAQATAPNPSWWVDNNNNFSQYDDYQYMNGHPHQGNTHDGSIILDPPGTHPYILSASASYDGVTAIGPRPYWDSKSDVDVFFTSDANASQEEEWECPEVVKRFLYLEYGTRSIPANGSQVVDNYTGTAHGYPSVYRKVPNDGSTQTYPLPGDVLSYNQGTNGHTALVKSVTNQSSGSATVQLIEQNASSTGLTYQDFNNWKFRNGIDNDSSGGDTVTGWLTPRTWSTVSDSNLGTNSYLQAVTSTSSSDVWAVGYSYGSGNYPYPVAIHWNGSSWGSNTISGYKNNILIGVSSISPSNVIAVGYNNSTATASAMLYNGTGWSAIPTDNYPSTGVNHYLNNVSSDSNGDTWAVGYEANSDIWSLIEQYVASQSAFQNWSPTGRTGQIPHLSGTSKNQLYGVTTISANDAWAVGYATQNSNNYAEPIAYHWDGSTWTSSVLPIPPSTTCAYAYAITALSSTDIWAVGYACTSGKAIAYIVHGTGSPISWNVVSSPSPDTLNILYNISAYDSSNIYAVGKSKSSGYYHTLILRYDGTQWKQMTSTNPGGSSYDNNLNGVNVTTAGSDPGEAWAVGYYNTSPIIEQLY